MHLRLAMKWCLLCELWGPACMVFTAGALHWILVGLCCVLTPLFKWFSMPRLYIPSLWDFTDRAVLCTFTQSPVFHSLVLYNWNLPWWSGLAGLRRECWEFQFPLKPMLSLWGCLWDSQQGRGSVSHSCLILGPCSRVGLFFWATNQPPNNNFKDLKFLTYKSFTYVVCGYCEVRCSPDFFHNPFVICI